jgi:hypothetical protein
MATRATMAHWGRPAAAVEERRLEAAERPVARRRGSDMAFSLDSGLEVASGERKGRVFCKAWLILWTGCTEMSMSDGEQESISCGPQRQLC